MTRGIAVPAALLTLLLPLVAQPARAQQLDMSQGGPVTVTAQDGIDWNQDSKQVIAHGNARAVRGNVTVDADRLIAFYRKKTDPAANGAAAKPADAKPGDAKPAPAANATKAAPGIGTGTGTGTNPADPDTGSTEIYRLAAEGNVHIYTQTDQAQGDRAVYDMDQAVLVLTGHDLKLTTPNEVLTARDDIEYWPQKHMAVARGDAVIVTKDARRMAADTLVAYTKPNDQNQQNQPPGSATQVAAKTPPPVDASKPAAADDPMAASGKLEKVEAYGHVSIRTVTDTVTGDRAVYVPDTGIARVLGNVHITRGENQINGAEAEVNQKTGISRLLSGPSERVQGLVVPNDANSPGANANQTKPGSAQAGVPGTAPPAKPKP
jgi:lipopolysaccharide export system protein LptA